MNFTCSLAQGDSVIPPFFLKISFSGQSELQRRHNQLSKVDEENPLKEIVTDCLQNDPQQRPRAEQLVHRLERHKSRSLSDVRLSDHSQLVAERVSETTVGATRSNVDYVFKVVLVGSSGVGKIIFTIYFGEPYPYITIVFWYIFEVQFMS